ncbi:MAG: endonuclease/exonuclease/phosphatase family protein [Planctomycetota bacterium]
METLRCGRLAAALLVCLMQASALGQLRVVTWNTLDGPRTVEDQAPFSTVLQALNQHSVNGIAKPIDVLALQETNTTPVNRLINILNALNPAGSYRAVTNAPTNDAVGLIYNENTLRLLNTSIVGGDPRPAVRAEFNPVGYSDPDATVSFYSFHLKAGGSSSDASRRAATAAAYRADADARARDHVVFLGDYNIRRSTEGGFANFTAPGSAQAFDPLDRPGNYSSSSSGAGFADLHTHSTTDLDARYDIQLVTGELLDGEGLSYIGPTASGTAASHSYLAFGNNGRLFNRPITESDALPAPVLQALRDASDHLPVVADYQLPARMAVALEQTAPFYFRGQDATVDLLIENTAPVVAAAGADELDYIVIAGGDASAAAGSGSVRALQGPARSALTLHTDQAGPRQAGWLVASDSALVENGVAQGQVNFTVLDHATASFDPQSPVTALTLDVGELAVGSRWEGSASLFNLQDTPGYTADLLLGNPLPSSGENGPQLELSLDDSLVAAGEATALHFTLDTADTSPGAFSRTARLAWGDIGTLGGFNPVPQFLDLEFIGRLIQAPPALIGDMNGDQRVDNADINALTLSLTDAAAYAARFPGLDPDVLGDFTGDGRLTNADLNGFIRLLTSSGLPLSASDSRRLATVPEPGLFLPAIGWVLGLRYRRRGRR